MEPEQVGATGPSEAGALFPVTQWSLVQRAQGESTVALNTLCSKYRRPLLAWMQSRQRELHGLEPEDLVNAFLAFKLPQQILKTVTPEKGKFRSFVRICLKNYASDEVAKRQAAIRGGGLAHQSVDEVNEQGQSVVEPLSVEARADEEFDRSWGLAILESAIHKLEDELSRKGHLRLWHRLESLLYEEVGAAGYAEVARDLEMSTASLHTAACRIRQRLRTLIREEVRETVASPEDFKQELKQFITLFGRSRRP
jgi:DNA-directed RNA polymerase specialized sigma24 family protein